MDYSEIEKEFANYPVIRRNGDVVKFEANKISNAISKAYISTYGSSILSRDSVRDQIHQLTMLVLFELKANYLTGCSINILNIQDTVELILMRNGESKVAKGFVLFREKWDKEFAKLSDLANANVIDEKGNKTLLNTKKLTMIIKSACSHLENVSHKQILASALKNIYDGVSEKELEKSIILASRQMIELEPNYNFVTARLLLNTIAKEVFGKEVNSKEMQNAYKEYFPKYINLAIDNGLLNPALANFNLEKLANALVSKRDLQFKYLGIQTLYDRYFLHINGRRIELAQIFFMRVAMGLALLEKNKDDRAIEFYNILSTFDFMSSTPTLFNSGTLHSQLSSCYLSTISDDLIGIYDGIKDNALLSKFAGGLGNDWTPIRAMGSHIKGTNGKSQGVIPFLKVVNDTAVAVNQCFAPHTKLYTNNGVKQFRDINNNDLALNQSGEYREIREILKYDIKDEMIKIKPKYSIFSTEVTSGHPFYVIQGVSLGENICRILKKLENNKINPEWVEAGKLKKGDFVSQVIPKEVIPTNFTNDDMRFYGIMLGDGHITKNGLEFGITGNENTKGYLKFVREYLSNKGIKFHEIKRGVSVQIKGSMGEGVIHNPKDGRFSHAGKQTIPFSRSDLYNENDQKRISQNLTHIQIEKTLCLIRGLIETDGNIIRGNQISFSNTSEELIDGLRYQLLRCGIPSSGQYRERFHNHSATRSNGEQFQFNNLSKSYDLRIPATKELASLLGCKPVTKYNWFVYNGLLYSRIIKVENIEPHSTVYDLKVDGEPNYMIVDGLVHNGGKRKGAVCAYLETWHYDIEEFLELRKNTGDDRRRCHDMNSANWIPDLFMKRVHEQGEWTLFSPSEVTDLHDKYGKDFETAYVNYEKLADEGKIKLYKKLPALQLWRKILTMLFETGHPWITFKDPCNIRSPQKHVGVVHSSNLCTEITLNTNQDEIAVCNLGSVNLVNHIKDGVLDEKKLEKTIKTAMRMLDNVVDINFYPVKKAENSNLKHRPVGLGIMGFQDCLHILNIPYASEKAVEFADKSMELVAYNAYLASSDLAKEKGIYSTYKGSLWDQGILPHESIDLLKKERNGYLDVNNETSLNWTFLKEKIKKDGMRNSNCIAIAPTATISNIIGVTASIEPSYQNIYVKSNLSGEFTVVNEYLIDSLKKHNLWDDVMLADLKYFDGSLNQINRIPKELKDLYATSFEIEPEWLIEAASRRQKWIDQAQSLNIYVSKPSGKKLDQIYKLAWIKGLKTTYYLRTLGATSAEKSTGSGGELNAVNHDGSASTKGQFANTENLPATDAKFCSIDNPDCEACQ